MCASKYGVACFNIILYYRYSYIMKLSIINYNTYFVYIYCDVYCDLQADLRVSKIIAFKGWDSDI